MYFNHISYLPGGKRPLGRPRRRWEDNTKMDLQEVGSGGANTYTYTQCVCVCVCVRARVCMCMRESLSETWSDIGN
jgi:hypothetical protein